MSGKSKNNPANRNVSGYHECPKCEKLRKPLLYVPASGKKKMAVECSCGILDPKTGRKLN